MSEEIVQRAVISTPDGVALVGEDGSVFVLTTEDLERHRLTDEGATEFARRMGDDAVVGFAAPGIDVGEIGLSKSITIGKSGFRVPTVPAAGTLLAGIEDDEYRRR